MKLSTDRLLIFLLWVLSSSGTAQELQKFQAEDELENHIDGVEGNSDYSDMLIQNEYLLKHPINLNTAGIEELGKITKLDLRDINSLQAHIAKYGKFRSIYELQVIEHFDIDKIRDILPFVTIKEPDILTDLKDPKLLESSRQQIILSSSRRIEKSIGYLSDGTNTFKGNPYKYCLRYRASLGKYMSCGLSAEKDDGENISSGFISPYVQLSLPGKVKQLIIGDFQAAFGQGLCFGSGLSFGKSSFVLDVMKKQNGIRVNRALNENSLLRGLGCTIQISPKILWTSFFSQKRIDATVNQDSLSDGFSGLTNTGNYRTETELSKKSNLKRRIAGSNMAFHSGSLKLGITGIFTQYAYPQQHDEKHLYQLYDATGSTIYNLGSDYQFAYKNILFFGEMAMNNRLRTFSTLNGFVAALGKNMDITLLYRNYNKRYVTSISSAFGETGDHQNETGLYMAFSLVPFKHYKLNAYADIYHFKWLRYQADAPSKGSDILLELQYNKRKSFNWYLRYRKEEKQKNESGTQTLNRLDQQTRSSLRLQLEIKTHTALTLKSRIEQVWYNSQFGASYRGMLIFQDLQIQVHPKIKLITRLMFFDVEDYDSRVYAYENDMLYTFSVPAFQNRGTRFYLLLKYKINKNLYLCFRFARTSYDNANSIGSGQDKINSNKATDTGIQLQWTL